MICLPHAPTTTLCYLRLAAKTPFATCPVFVAREVSGDVDLRDWGFSWTGRAFFSWTGPRIQRVDTPDAYPGRAQPRVS